MTIKIKQSKREIQIASGDIKGDPRPTKQALGFEPEALIVVDHRGETFGIPIEKLQPHQPAFAQEAANSDPARLAGLTVTSLDYMAGFRQIEDKTVLRRIVEYTPAIVASLTTLLDCKFIYLKCGPINPITDNFKIQVIVTNAKNADELRHHLRVRVMTKPVPEVRFERDGVSISFIPAIQGVTDRPTIRLNVTEPK